MYGRHLDEKFAIEVGMSLPREKLGDTVIISQYSGKPDHPDYVPTPIPVREDRPYYPGKRRPSFPNKRKFIKSFFPLDYVVDIHNGFPPSDHYPRDYPVAMISYQSKRRIHKEIQDAIIKYCLTTPYNSIWFFLGSTRYGFKELDQVEIELMPPHIARDESVSFVRGVIDILSSRGPEGSSARPEVSLRQVS